jgi:hypothetical protein
VIECIIDHILLQDELKIFSLYSEITDMEIELIHMTDLAIKNNRLLEYKD